MSASAYPAPAEDNTMPPATMVEAPETAPVPVIRPEELQRMGQKLKSLFDQYVSDRRIAELRWLRNLRQYLGVYDPDIEQTFSPQRSKAYPRITRVKCISVLSRIMNLMFPGNERNWQLKASPSPDLPPEVVMEQVQKLLQMRQQEGAQPVIDDELVNAASMAVAEQRAELLSKMIDDQLQELGGDQTLDYVQLNRKVLQSGILYGLGVLRGPFVRTVRNPRWIVGEDGMPAFDAGEQMKPQFDFLPIWDFYPDMSAKTMSSMDGYFIRLVMARQQVRKLADRRDFFPDQIKQFLAMNATGNYKAQPFETELRSMGVKVNVNEQKPETQKYEAIVWHGPVSGHFLRDAGVDVPEDKLADDIDAEVWMLGDRVISAKMNPWRSIGADVKTIHTFIFDEDDTSPVGNGLPYVIRDSQMSVAAAARMLLDNASVVCGPNLEVNTDLLRPDQDLTSVTSYKIWYREGTGPEAQWPAVRQVPIEGHLGELSKIIEMFMSFADTETFVNPATGGDMEKGYSEPMRTAAGASMMRGDAALPFKDIVRSFDNFTQSVITSLVEFNRRFNPGPATEGDYNVIARGATSLIAKEIRGIQADVLAQSLTPEDRVHIDERKLVEARLRTRDFDDMLVPEETARARKEAQSAAAQQAQELQKQMAQAEVRKTLADAFKNIAQGQKNSANADAATVQTALNILESAINGLDDGKPESGSQPAGKKPSGPKK